MIVDPTMNAGVFTYVDQYVSDSNSSTPRMTGLGGIEVYALTMRRAGTATFRVAYAVPSKYDGDWGSFSGTKFTYTFLVH